MTSKTAPSAVRRVMSDQPFDIAGSGELITFTAQNLNTAAQPVVFTTDDAAWGKLLFTATNASTEMITLTESSVLSVYLDSLLTDDEIGKITLATATWSGGPVKDDLGTHLAFNPKASITLPPSQSIEIEVAGALATGLAITGYFIFNYSGFSVPNGESRIQGFRQATPDSTVPWPLNLSWAPRAAYQELADTVYVTPWTGQAGIENSFILQIENTQSSPIAIPAKSTPRIVVSFVAGSTALSLCSEDQLKQVSAAVTQSDWPWTVTVDENGPLPVFIFTPDAGNLDLFNGGGVLAITFSGLVTDLAPDYASPVFVQYAGLTSVYEDGYSSVVINKTVPTPYVTQFGATSYGSAIAANDSVGCGPVTVTWNVFAAQTCMLRGVSTVFPPEGTYTFTPSGPYPAQVDCYLQPQVGPSDFDGAELPFTMVVVPPQVFMTVSIEMSGSAYSLILSWTTAHAASCQVFDQDNDNTLLGQGLSGSWSKPVQPGPVSMTIEIVMTGCQSQTISEQFPINLTIA